MAKRVHELAKELGVKSTAIVSKCQAEGLPIKNHMSTLSAGLEATILEWFSEHAEGDQSITVQTTAPVDLAKVKTKKKRKPKAKPKAEPAEAAAADAGPQAPAAVTAQPIEAAAGPAAPAGPETPAAALPVPPAAGWAPTDQDLSAGAAAEDLAGAKGVRAARLAKPKRKSPKELATEGPEEPAAEGGAAAEWIEPPIPPDAEEASKETAAASEAVDRTPAPPRMAPGFIKKAAASEPTEKVKPTVKHVPAPAKLKGPQVVRIEQPEEVRRPPARSSGRVTLKDLMPSTEADAGDEESRTKTTGKRGRRRSILDGSELSEKDIAAKQGKSRSRRRGGGRGHEVRNVMEPHEWGDRDWQERQERLAQAGAGKLSGRARRLARDDERTMQSYAQPRKIEKATIKEPIEVKALSAAIGVRVNEIIGKLISMGVLATINQTIEAEAAQAVALEYGVELTVEAKKLLLDELQDQFDRPAPADQLEPRPPVVAFLGHVDHGKTSLLDRIRKASVAAGEAGGITQHIGSYLYDDGKRRVTFLDTPGHKAFTAMRARGANMTDIVVLVVAADDGVMPQTEEAISHARAAQVPIVVALNKMDLPNADVNKVLGQLAEKGLVAAEWSGETEIVRTSAATGEGIEDLIEHLDYVAELHQLKALRTGPATGWVVEAEMTTGQGVLTRLLVKQGTLRPGDVLVSGCAHGRVRTIADATGRWLTEAGPSMPIEVTGLDEVPIAGDRFYTVPDFSRAAQIADEQKARRRETSLAQRRQITLENLFAEIAAGDLRELNVIVKADVQGSVDVLRESITEQNTSEVAVRVLHAAVGGVTESDVLLAEASNAIIIGFQVVADETARHLAEQKNVEIRHYRVIYHVTEDIRQALEGMLAPRIEEKHVGRIEVRQLFKISRFGTIAGCFVIDGTISRSSRVRLVRDNIVIRNDMSIQSMRRGKEDISESRAGFECGIKLADYDDLKVGDVIEAYEMIEISRTLPTEAETVKAER